MNSLLISLLILCEMGQEGGTFLEGRMVEIVWHTVTCVEWKLLQTVCH